MRRSVPGIENPSQRVSGIQTRVHGRQILGQRLKTRPAGSSYRDSVKRDHVRSHLAATTRLLRICNRMVRRMVGEPKASAPHGFGLLGWSKRAAFSVPGSQGNQAFQRCAILCVTLLVLLDASGDLGLLFL